MARRNDGYQPQVLSAPAHVHTVTDSTNLTLGNNVAEKKACGAAAGCKPEGCKLFVRNWNLATSNGDASPTFEDDQVSLMRNMRLPLDEVRYMLENYPPAFTKIRAVLASASANDENPGRLQAFRGFSTTLVTRRHC